jgi:hypothetical protein
MKLTTRIQLSAMMFMEFFIWGGWFVTLSPFLTNNFNATGSTQAKVFSTQSWGRHNSTIYYRANRRSLFQCGENSWRFTPYSEQH